MGCLYQLTSPSGKSYIGITTKTVEKRFAKHVEHAIGKRENGVVYSALRKYGPSSFSKKILVVADNWDYLCDLERKAIVAFGTRHPSGYNMTEGGEGVIGPRSAADRAKMSIAQKKRFAASSERKRLADDGKKGALKREAINASRRIDGRPPWLHRKHVSMARVGSEEHRAKISAATKTAMAKPEVAAAMKRFAAERAANPEWRKKIGDSRRGKKSGPRTPEQRITLVASLTAAWADPVKKAERVKKNAAARKITNPGVDLICGNCAKTFNVPDWVARSKSPKNCSRACYFASKKNSGKTK
jgi:group I intron endonuclease